ncbi:sulfotransferase family 2 domain-containing protein [Cyanobium sp. ATX 6A2]|uniref:sulfotransferase family 2 domain-containing protein n=1 Tax=Cyanobium sp. ATX 6A2 TaxID=2823700 RepID=UPI0020CEF36F|nr:sulfotransferase family 2 domain-containing protein [Cyanobium sp. ATX 6A2]MCP9889026.1 sulfotransferase family 2 domain-containing protein [Cyanobium sp. ATX 6A2]
MNNRRDLPLKSKGWLFSKNIAYHTWVSEKNRYLYFGTPKTACTRVKLSLQKMEGYRLPDRILDIHDRADSALRYPRNLLDFSSEKQHQIINSNRWYRFSFVRNPYYRMYSAFENQLHNFSYPEYNAVRKELNRRGGITFRNFIEYISQAPQDTRDPHWELQHRLLGIDQIKYTFIGKYEFFATDFVYILTALGASEEVLATVGTKVNQRIGPPPELAFDEHVANLIYEYCKSDFQVFNYSQDSWPRSSA